MRMIPSYIQKDTSNAERRIFDLLSKEDGLKGYTCFHSLGLARHSYKSESEVDFVLLGPNGLFVLEIKGGRVRREGGVWKFTDRYGRVTNKRESPFNQAKSGMYSLKSDLLRKFGPSVDKYVMGYGVVFPDIKFSETSPEWDTRMIADSRSLDENFLPWLSAFIHHWEKRHHDRHNVPPSALKDLSSYLRGDFETIRPISMDIKESEEIVIKLTNEQFGALDAMDDNKRMMFAGPAGTGKTLLAIEKARRNNSKGIRTLFLCYNKLLGSFLAEEIRKEKLDNVKVDSLHHFFYQTIIDAGYGDQLESKQGSKNLFSEIYPEYFLKAWNPDNTYEELIIDEGQDIISPEYITALDDTLSGGFSQGRWTIFMDPETQKDMFVSFDESVYNELKNLSASYQLTVNCRNTKPIAIQAEVISGYPLGRVKKIKGLPVKYLWYDSSVDQAKQVTECINKLLNEDVAPEDIVILSTKRYQASLAGSGRLRLKAGYYQLGKGASTAHRGLIACGTIQAYKGLESSVVVLTDIEEIDTKDMKTVNYVGYTRARTALWVSLSQKLKKEYEHHFTKIAANEGVK